MWCRHPKLWCMTEVTRCRRTQRNDNAPDRAEKVDEEHLFTDREDEPVLRPRRGSPAPSSSPCNWGTWCRPLFSNRRAPSTSAEMGTWFGHIDLGILQLRQRERLTTGEAASQNTCSCVSKPSFPPEVQQHANYMNSCAPLHHVNSHAPRMNYHA